jgi:hypothetical protein
MVSQCTTLYVQKAVKQADLNVGIIILHRVNELSVNLTKKCHYLARVISHAPKRKIRS